MELFDRTMQVMAKALDWTAARQEVIASNLANEETPGFRAKDFPFESHLKALLDQRGTFPLAVTHPGHQGPLVMDQPMDPGAVQALVDAAPGLDGNTVQLEQELAKLSMNAMQYQALSTLTSLRLRQLLSAIQDSR